MFNRLLALYLSEIQQNYASITLLGPRQSGKTTLAKAQFKNYEYFSLEDPETRLRAISDPKRFLENIKNSAILDEIQNVPELLSYIQGILDEPNDERKFVFTGSNSLLLSERISQSLAGRTRILYVLPLERTEIPIEQSPTNINDALFLGGYPRPYDENLNITTWCGDYYQTYIQKDVRSLTNIGDLATFDRFVRLVAGRCGQLINASSIGGDAGITSPTVKHWLSILEASFITFSLQPHFRNFSKRVIKAPKIYFYDTGLLCYLLRIVEPAQLEVHPLRGAIFENWVIAEYIKNCYNRGVESPYYFWRDQHGHEVDLVADRGTHLELIEIKSGQTFQDKFLKNMEWLAKLQKHPGGKLIYGGEKSFTFEDFKIISWTSINE